MLILQLLEQVWANYFTSIRLRAENWAENASELLIIIPWLYILNSVHNTNYIRALGKQQPDSFCPSFVSHRRN